MMTTEIVRRDDAFDRAELALIEAQSLAEVVDVRDQAEAIRVLVARQHRGLDWENRAAEIKIRAELKAGELLAAIPRAQGSRTDLATSDHDGPKFAATVDAAGIALQTAKQWQAVAAIPEERFEAHIAEIRLDGGELTTAGLLRVTRLDPLMSLETPE